LSTGLSRAPRPSPSRRKMVRVKKLINSAEDVVGEALTLTRLQALP
jgi:hypothetical protein